MTEELKLTAHDDLITVVCTIKSCTKLMFDLRDKLAKLGMFYQLVEINNFHERINESLPVLTYEE